VILHVVVVVSVVFGIALCIRSHFSHALIDFSFCVGKENKEIKTEKRGSKRKQNQNKRKFFLIALCSPVKITDISLQNNLVTSGRQRW